eukprot:scaffold90356_cov21-Tisochrysis_lutea.AAC.1
MAQAAQELLQREEGHVRHLQGVCARARKSEACAMGRVTCLASGRCWRLLLGCSVLKRSGLQVQHIDTTHAGAKAPYQPHHLIIMHMHGKMFGHAPNIPDIYDSAKYDANHNDHLNLDLRVGAVNAGGHSGTAE